ncbi:hypothetical protein AB1484_20410 [Parafrankia sp. FMc6]|uniref:hypothetical protein n=1 Tax=Parafrankia soli TaxID=2599596 RepID=UPI0034D62E35
MAGYFRACGQSMFGAFRDMLSVFLWAGVSFYAPADLLHGRVVPGTGWVVEDGVAFFLSEHRELGGARRQEDLIAAVLS